MINHKVASDFIVRNRRCFFNIYTILLMGVLPLIIVPSDADRFYEPKVLFLYFITILFLPFLYNKKTWREKGLIENILPIFMVLILLSTIFSIDIQTSLFGKTFRKEGGITIIFYGITFFMFYKEFKYSEKVANIIFFLVSIVALYGIAQYLGFDMIPRDEIRRGWVNLAFSTIGNKNFFGSLMVLMIPIAVSIYSYTGKKLFLLYGSIMFCGLVASITRGCWIAFCIYSAVLFMYSISKRKIRRRMVLTIIIFLSIYAALNYRGNGEINKRAATINQDINKLKTENNDTVGSSRMYIWKRGITFIPQRPLLGSGPDTFGLLFMDKYSNEVQYMINITGGIVDKAHNEYLQLAVTSGIPALIVYLSLVCYIVLKLFVFIRRNDNFIYVGVMCSIIGYLMQAFFNISVVGIAPIFWAMLGIGANISINNAKLEI